MDKPNKVNALSGDEAGETDNLKRLKKSSSEEPIIATTGPYLLDLSDDVMLIMLSFLPQIDIIMLGQTCSRLETLTLDRTLWLSVDCRGRTMDARTYRCALASLLPTTRALALDLARVIDAPAAKDDASALAEMAVMRARDCIGLRALTLENARIDACRLQITHFPSRLTYWSLKGSTVEDLPFERSYFMDLHNHMPNLQTLVLSECPWFQAHSLMAIAKCPLLRELRLDGCIHLGNCMAYCSMSARFAFKSLETLDVRRTRLSDSEIGCFNRVTTLKHLLVESLSDLDRVEFAQNLAEDSVTCRVLPSRCMIVLDRVNNEYIVNRQVVLRPDIHEDEINHIIRNVDSMDRFIDQGRACVEGAAPNHVAMRARNARKIYIDIDVFGRRRGAPLSARDVAGPSRRRDDAQDAPEDRQDAAQRQAWLDPESVANLGAADVAHYVAGDGPATPTNFAGPDFVVRTSPPTSPRYRRDGAPATPPPEALVADRGRSCRSPSPDRGAKRSRGDAAFDRPPYRNPSPTFGADHGRDLDGTNGGGCSCDLEAIVGMLGIPNAESVRPRRDRDGSRAGHGDRDADAKRRAASRRGNERERDDANRIAGRANVGGGAAARPSLGDDVGTAGPSDDVDGGAIVSSDADIPSNTGKNARPSEAPIPSDAGIPADTGIPSNAEDAVNPSEAPILSDAGAAKPSEAPIPSDAGIPSNAGAARPSNAGAAIPSEAPIPSDAGTPSAADGARPWVVVEPGPARRVCAAAGCSREVDDVLDGCDVEQRDALVRQFFDTANGKLTRVADDDDSSSESDTESDDAMGSATSSKFADGRLLCCHYRSRRRDRADKRKREAGADSPPFVPMCENDNAVNVVVSAAGAGGGDDRGHTDWRRILRERATNGDGADVAKQQAGAASGPAPGSPGKPARGGNHRRAAAKKALSHLGERWEVHTSSDEDCAEQARLQTLLRCANQLREPPTDPADGTGADPAAPPAEDAADAVAGPSSYRAGPSSAGPGVAGPSNAVPPQAADPRNIRRAGRHRPTSCVRFFVPPAAQLVTDAAVQDLFAGDADWPYMVRIAAEPSPPSRLETLVLRGYPGVTDQSLRVLAAVATLRALDVTGTGVTADGVATFRALRPEVSLDCSFD